MSPARAQRQRGIALLALLAVIALGASWFVVSRLNNDSNAIVAANRNRNAAVLNRAKQTLIGYIAQQASENTEDNPGRLPCPEAPGSFDNPTTEGIASGNCTLPVVGRFPWRTLGMDRLVDAAGEPLWYVISPGWAYTSSNLVINSNTAGQLTVDGNPNDSVALIIAPGPAFAVPAASGCAAWNQVRPTTGTPDWRNYLECENATNPADSTFVTTGPSSSFNDQVVRVTVADVLPAIEAAIAHRIERDVAPAIKSMYSNVYPSSSPYYNPNWPAALTFPFPAAFANPSTSATQGSSLILQGLLPLVYAETSPGSGTLCTPSGAAPRCNPTFVSWSSANMSGASVYAPSCTTTASQVNCTYYYRCFLGLCGLAGTTSVSFTINATASNVGMAMRQLNQNAAIANIDAGSATASAVLNANGSATVSVSATSTLPGTGSLVSNALCSISGILGLFFGCAQYSVSVPITLFADHPILNSASTGAGNLGWFLRNKWNEVTYYTIAAGFAPSGSKSCITNSTCLYATYHPNNGKLRGLILLSGRGLSGQARPSGTLTDYLEGSNATANGSSANPFQIRSPTLLTNRTFDDRIAVIDSN